jgi:hypothetical protein
VLRGLLLGVVLAGLALVGCGSGGPAPKPPLTGDGAAAALRGSGLPVTDVRVFTAETDPNKLLGRPGEYTHKVSWQDTRTPGEGNDATIEVFATADDLKRRKAYTEAIARTGGLFAQYVEANEARLALLRLPHDLTPDQAKGYRDWLAAL